MSMILSYSFRSIFIKQAKKGSCVVVWCRDDYIKGSNKQFEDKILYKDINFKETILLVLVDKSNRIFKNLYTRNFKKTTKLGKLHILPKINKWIYNVPVSSNSGTPTEKALEFFDFHLKSLMKNGWSYIRDSSNFNAKMKRIEKDNDGFFLVT